VDVSAGKSEAGTVRSRACGPRERSECGQGRSTSQQRRGLGRCSPLTRPRARFDRGFLASALLLLLSSCSSRAHRGTLTIVRHDPPPVPESIVACGTDVSLGLGTPALSSTLVGDDMARGSCVRGSSPECVFMLDVPARSDVRLSLESVDFDGALVLLDEHRSNEILCVDDSPTGDTHHTRIETTLGPGRYAVMVEGANGEAGQFALFAEVDPLPSAAEACALASPLAPGATVRGSTRSAPNQFGASCASGADGPDRVHTFEINEPARVRIWQQSEHESALYMRAHCEDPSTEIVCSDEVGENRSLITAELAMGRYYVYSDSYSRAQGGDYVLSMEQTVTPRVSSAEACAAANAAPLVPGEYEIDTFYAPSALAGSCGGSGVPERLFHLSLAEETTIQVELLEPEFDAVLYLRVECDDDRSELSCVRAPKAEPTEEAEAGARIRTLAATIGPGQYTLGVDGQFENQMGAARMRVTVLPLSLARTAR
jgi:hypothetical protein